MSEEVWMSEENPIPQERRPSRAPYLVVALLLLAAAGGGAWWFLHRPVEEPKIPEPLPADAATPVPVPPPPAMPSAAEADDLVRKLAGAVSSAKEFAQWLQSGDLARRFVSTVNAIAEGDSPRTSLTFLAPKHPFKVMQQRGRSFVDPKGYQRYDEFADVIASVDASAVATAFAALHPLLDSAYHEIGRPGTSLDERLAQAIGRLVAVPVPTRPVEVKAPALVYKYIDPRLEGQSAAGKHLLRMGPRNMTLVQVKLREVAAALKLPEAK